MSGNYVFDVQFDTSMVLQRHSSRLINRVIMHEHECIYYHNHAFSNILIINLYSIVQCAEQSLGKLLKPMASGDEDKDLFYPAGPKSGGYQHRCGNYNLHSLGRIK